MTATDIASSGAPAPDATLKPFVMRKPRVGLFVGAMQWYWTMTGMEALKAAVVADGERLADLLAQQGVDVLSTELIASHDDAAAAGRRFRDQKVDLVVFYHGTYVDDKMTYAFLEEYGDGAVVLAHTQGLDEIPEEFSLIDYARCWGNNSCVQIIGSAMRLRPNRTIAYAFGHMPDVAEQVASYARAAKAITNVKNCKVGFLPHRCNDAPMYDTFPDETQMMSQTGVAITYCYIHELEDELKKITDSDEEALLREVLAKDRVHEGRALLRAQVGEGLSDELGIAQPRAFAPGELRGDELSQDGAFAFGGGGSGAPLEHAAVDVGYLLNELGPAQRLVRQLRIGRRRARSLGACRQTQNSVLWFLAMENSEVAR